MSALSLLRRRRKRRTFERHQTQNRLTRVIISIGSSLAGILGGLIIAGAFAYAFITAGLPSTELLSAQLDPVNGSLLQPTRIYDRSGTHLLLTLAPQDTPRSYIPFAGADAAAEHLPDTLIRASVALLDPEFWTHPGYRLEGITNPYEHPSLAQKLVADLLLWNEPADLRRAIRERILAAQITSQFGREKILEWYLNSANYGHFAYGAEAAAKLYLGKPISQINLAEAALLASVNQSPAINPLDAPQAALQRQADALNLIQSRGMAAADEVDLARLEQITFQKAPEQPNIAPAFTALALSQIAGRSNLAHIEQGGMQVLTTLDYDLQLRANCALQTQLARLNSAETSAPQPCAGSETLPPLSPGQNTPQAASAVVLDPRTGQILALIGDSKQDGDSGYLTPHRPGTLLNPFIYLTGFTRGLSPATLVWDLPPEDAALTGADSKPAAAAARAQALRPYLGPLRLRTALTNDSLTTAAQVFNQMGAGLVQQTMAPFGLDIPAADWKALLETENRYSVIQIAQAYGIFAAQGALIGQPAARTDALPVEKLLPSTILTVRSIDHRIFAADKDVMISWDITKSEQVVSSQLAYLITDALRAETLPTSANFLDLGRPTAIKTGMTLDETETWAAGYTPYRVAVVWMGYDLPVAGAASLSTRPTAGLWTAIMQSASRDVAPDNWTQPSGMLRMKVCDPSGMLPSEACPNVVEEIFIDGYQPTQIDTLYKTYAINRETGLLAVVFTPEQVVEKRVYMRVPPEAQAWAKSVNLPMPPSQYDNIQPPLPNPEANITSPNMFANLQGLLTITGNAAGADFSYYRLQYGQGLNPETWTQIGTDITTPVKNAKLAEWDTSGLRGLYSVQLLVVRSDHSLQTATVQITVNNP